MKTAKVWLTIYDGIMTGVLFTVLILITYYVIVEKITLTVLAVIPCMVCYRLANMCALDLGMSYMLKDENEDDEDEEA